MSGNLRDRDYRIEYRLGADGPVMKSNIKAKTWRTAEKTFRERMADRPGVEIVEILRTEAVGSIQRNNIIREA